VLQTQSSQTDQYYTTIQRAMKAGSAVPDVFAGDVIWPAQLAGQNLLLPVDKYFSASMQKQYIPGTIQDVTYNGHIYGAPWFTDFGLIYYRKDLLAKYHMSPPTTWEQMQQEAKTLVQKGAAKEGFVFQGSQYEGLVCDALEYINGAGGRIYGPQAASTKAQAAKGLATMRSMITSGASPNAVTTYLELNTANDFTAGLAAFARNWPYMWANAQAKGSKVIGKVGVLPMLHEPGQSTGYSTLGGWWLGINKNTKYPDQAWTFINYLISSAQQQYWAIHGGHAVALISADDSPSVVAANPWLKSVASHLNILPRPTSPVYNDISQRMAQDFHSVLTGSMQPSAAVSDIESFIQQAQAAFK
jgi:multiple sugar transport system substrate-binding protein